VVSTPGGQRKKKKKMEKRERERERERERKARPMEWSRKMVGFVQRKQRISK
jgi:hypothetical protein